MANFDKYAHGNLTHEGNDMIFKNRLDAKQIASGRVH